MNKGHKKGDLNDSYRNTTSTTNKGESPHSNKDHKHKKAHKTDHSSQQQQNLIGAYNP